MISGKRQNCGPVRSEKTNLWQPLFCPLVISVVGVITCGPGQRVSSLCLIWKTATAPPTAGRGRLCSNMVHGIWEQIKKQLVGDNSYLGCLVAVGGCVNKSNVVKWIGWIVPCVVQYIYCRNNVHYWKYFGFASVPKCTSQRRGQGKNKNISFFFSPIRKHHENKDIVHLLAINTFILPEQLPRAFKLSTNTCTRIPQIIERKSQAPAANPATN